MEHNSTCCGEGVKHLRDTDIENYDGTQQRKIKELVLANGWNARASRLLMM
jgi:hypothetical protein